MHPLIEWTAAALIVIAAFFLLVGAIGLARYLSRGDVVE